MTRLVDRVIKRPLSERLLFGSLAAGGAVRLVVEDDSLVIRETAPGGAEEAPGALH
jgi:hypothetical protein